jgi:hypothetical protein
MTESSNSSDILSGNLDTIYNLSKSEIDEHGNNVKIWNFHGYNVFEYNNSNIFVIENIFEDFLCDEVIDIINTLKLNKNLYQYNNNVECLAVNINDLFDEDDSFFYEFNTQTSKYNEILNKINTKGSNIYNNYMNGITKDKLRRLIRIYKKKTKTVTKVMKNINNHISFQFNAGIILRKIFGKTRLHTDGLQLDKSFNKTFFLEEHEDKLINMNTIVIRNATAIFSLNDNYNGGEFIFPHFNVKLKLKKGSVLIFPPYWTHYHETNNLLDSTYRYTLTSWYGEELK